MSHNNFNKNLIKSLGGNFKLSGNIHFLSTSDVFDDDGNRAILIQATQKFDSPPKCTCCDEDTDVVRNGTKTITIRHLRVFNYTCAIKLKKQRFLCRNSEKTFTIDEPEFMSRRARISTDTKTAIALELKNKLSLTDIARLFDVSISTVARVFNDFYSDTLVKNETLPTVISIDEFKSTKDSDGAMSCILIDSKSRKIVDIIEDRKLTSLSNYVSSFSLNVRKKVENIVIDMYSPYMSLAKTYFPNAKVSIDGFHVVNHVNRALNMTRTGIMKNYKTKNPSLYNKYERYWKLILKDSNKLSEVTKYYNKFYKKYISEADIVKELLSHSEELENSYTVYQNVLYGIKSKNMEFLRKTVLNNKELLSKASERMKTAVKTLKKYEEYLENAVTYEYSNGGIEGVNNKIKVLKRSVLDIENLIILRKEY